MGHPIQALYTTGTGWLGKKYPSPNPIHGWRTPTPEKYKKAPLLITKLSRGLLTLDPTIANDGGTDCSNLEVGIARLHLNVLFRGPTSFL